MNLWPSIWTHVEQNKEETLANNISSFNVTRLFCAVASEPPPPRRSGSESHAA